MNIKNTSVLLSAACALICTNAYPAGKQMIKLYTTPPAPEEAISVTAIPPLYYAKAKTPSVAPAPSTATPATKEQTPAD